MRILIVEDEAKVASTIQEGLESQGYEAVVAESGEEGFYLVNAQIFDLVILDLVLPGRDGLEVLATLRRRDLQTPVIIVTARDGLEDKVLGLDAGADDYLVKPFAFAELLARIRALLRRGRPDQVLRLKVGELIMDLVSRSVTLSGERIPLTGREFELLEYLMRHPGQTITRTMLAQDVWNEPERATPLDNVIDVHIGRLRKKIGRCGGDKLIHTLRGVGFVLREEGGASAPR